MAGGEALVVVSRQGVASHVQKIIALAVGENRPLAQRCRKSIKKFGESESFFVFHRPLLERAVHGRTISRRAVLCLRNKEEILAQKFLR
jgi:hypothetical protein